MDNFSLNQWSLDLNSTLEEYDTADNSTSSNFPSDFTWGLFYLIVLAFIFIAIIIAVARIRNTLTYLIDEYIN